MRRHEVLRERRRRRSAEALPAGILVETQRHIGAAHGDCVATGVLRFDGQVERLARPGARGSRREDERRLPLRVGRAQGGERRGAAARRLERRDVSDAASRESGSDLEHRGPPREAERLGRLDPLTAARTDLRNPRRVLRALERAELAGGPAATTVRAEPYPGRLALIGLTRPLPILDRRIGERAEQMFHSGLLEETRALLERGLDPSLPAMTGHGYAEAARHLAGEWSLEEAITVTTRRVRRYTRRQLSWFRRDRRIVWLDAGDRPADDPPLVRQGSDLLRRLTLA